jgi:hypothetical protein
MIPAAERGKWVTLSVGAMRTPLEYVLAVALAIALARELSTTILDEALFWTKTYEQAPQALVDRLRLQRSSDSPAAAAEELYRSLPGA